MSGKGEMTDEQLTELLQTLRAPDEIGPRAGFYARVMDRVEAQQKSSIWSVFLEPVFSKRLAFASMALILLLGITFIQAGLQEEEVAFENQNGGQIVLVNGIDETPAPYQTAEPLRAAPVALMDAEQGREAVLVDMISGTQVH